MKKRTPRELIHLHVGGRNVTPGKLRRAIEACRAAGWVPAYLPQPEDADCELPMVREAHPFATLLQRVHEQSVINPSQPVTVAVAELLTYVHTDVPNASLSRSLGGHGLAVVNAAEQSVDVLGVTPSLAILVNRLRHRPYPRGMDDRIIVHQALGLPERPQRLREDMRLRAAEVLDRFDIEAEALLDTTTRRTPLRSKWLLHDRLDMAVEEAYDHVES